MYGLQWIAIFGQEWDDSLMIFTNDAVMSVNHWGIAPLMTKKMLFMVIHTLSQLYMLFYALNQYKIDEHKYWSLILPLWWRMTILIWYCDVTWTEGTGIVMLSLAFAPACAKWCKADIHKLILSMGIDLPPSVAPFTNMDKL